MSRVLRVVLPIVVVAVAALGAWWMVESRPTPEPQAREFPPPLVRVETAREQDLRLRVSTQGTVAPAARLSCMVRHTVHYVADCAQSVGAGAATYCSGQSGQR